MKDLDKLEVLLDYMEELGLDQATWHDHYECIVGMQWWQEKFGKRKGVILAFEGDGILVMEKASLAGRVYDEHWCIGKGIVQQVGRTGRGTIQAMVTPAGKRYWQLAKRW